eukprot:762597-Hanusia_phi.AAC.3
MQGESDRDEVSGGSVRGRDDRHTTSTQNKCQCQCQVSMSMSMSMSFVTSCQNLKEKRAKFYKQKVERSGVVPSKAVLAEIAQEMKLFDEKQRYDKLMLIQEYESEVQVRTPGHLRHTVIVLADRVSRGHASLL